MAMTPEQFAARKTRIYIIAGIGVAAFIGSNTVGYFAPSKGLLAILLTAIFLACIFAAAMMALRLNKETASRR